MKVERIIEEAAQQFTAELFVLLKSAGIDIMPIQPKEIGESLGRFAYKCFKVGFEVGRNTNQNNGEKLNYN